MARESGDVVAAILTVACVFAQEHLVLEPQEAKEAVMKQYDSIREAVSLREADERLARPFSGHRVQVS